MSKVPLYKPLIPGYVTNLTVNGTHDIGKVYNFNTISINDCEAIIATGSQHVKRIGEVKK